MKLLLYTHYWLPIPGGVQTMTNMLAQGLATHPEHEVEVTLVTQTPAGEVDDRTQPFQVIRQPNAFKLFAMIKAADVLHVANPAFLPLLFAWLLRRPFVIEHHGYQTACPNGLLLYTPDQTVCSGHFMAGRYAKCLACNSKELGKVGSARLLAFTFPRRWLARRATCNIAPSHHVSDRVSLPRTEVIRHGVHDTRANPDAFSAVGTRSPVSFAYVGRLVAEKGVPVLLHAADRLRKRGHAFRIKILGDGPLRGALEDMARDLDLGDRVDFVGSVPVQCAAEMLSGVMAVVVPSVWEEVAPLVPAEQLMSGNLVIASDLGGLSEIVGDYGLKFPAGNAEALASCMESVISNGIGLTEMRNRARLHALDVYSEDRMIEKHASLYRSLAR